MIEQANAQNQANIHRELDTVFSTYSGNFELTDPQGLFIVLATAIAHYIPGEMLWLRDYGGSRSGKTELLRAIISCPDCAELEKITPSAIRGGLKEGHRLLERINGKLVITKDFSVILTERKEMRNEIFGLLRNVKDGSLTSDFGTEEGYLHQEAKFDWIVATTPVFAQYKQMEDLLGARYIDLNWIVPETSRLDITEQAVENNPRLAEIRIEMAGAVRALMNTCKGISAPELSETERGLIVDWADLTALLRSPVGRDRYHRVVLNPEPEVGTDIAQGFQRIAKALKLLGGDEGDVALCIARLSRDSIPIARRELLLKLVEGNVVSNIDQYELEDMKLLGICSKTTVGYNLKPELADRILVLLSYWDMLLSGQ
jgi:predicted DNA-binding protein YlxM (UPF0122 family)